MWGSIASELDAARPGREPLVNTRMLAVFYMIASIGVMTATRNGMWNYLNKLVLIFAAIVAY